MVHLKTEYITDVTVKDNRVTKSVLSGFTREQYSENGQAVFKSLKPLVHSFVRDLVIAEYAEANALVRLKVKQTAHNGKLEQVIKVVSVDRVE